MKKRIKYNFVLITPGRSGSEHLSETLNTCEDIEMGGEIFNRTNYSTDSFNSYLKLNGRLKLLSFFFNREKLSKLKVNLPLRYLIQSFLSIKETSQIARGFKLTLDQLDAYPTVIDLLIMHNCKIVYLNRKDRLAQVLSLMKARQTGAYHHRTKDKENNRYTFDKTQVKQQYEEVIQRESELMKSIREDSYFSLSYEQLFQNYEPSIDSIRVFLDLPKSTSYQHSDLVKNNAKELDQWVENLDEVKQYLEG